MLTKNTTGGEGASKQGLKKWKMFDDPEDVERRGLPIRIYSKVRALVEGFAKATPDARRGWALYYVNCARNVRYRQRAALYQELLVSEESVIGRLTGADQTQIAAWDEEFAEVQSRISDIIARPSTADRVLQRLMYVVARHVAPEQVVETGVWHGVSSFCLLSALARNGRGELSSVDLAPLDARVRIDVGGAVPESLRANWHLHLGPTQTLLPEVMRRVGTVDLFIHDSSHWYHDMIQDFAAVWPSMRSGAALIADDVEFNDSIFDFADKMGLEPPSILSRDKYGYIGVLIKP